MCTEGRLILEFIYDDYMRIKSWHMAVRGHKELLPRTVITNLHHSPQPDPNILEQLGKNITRMGITNSTLNYLRVSGGDKTPKIIFIILKYFFGVDFIIKNIFNFILFINVLSTLFRDVI